MNTYLSPAGWFTFNYPKTWVVEDDMCTSVYKDEDGVGALQISAYETPDPESAAERLRQYLSDEGVAAEISSVIAGDHHIARAAFEMKGNYTLAMFIARGRHVLFATYNVASINEAVEIQAVEEIIHSIRITV